MGRKSKLVPDVTTKFLQAIEVGATIEAACQYAGIGTSTYYLWVDEAAAHPNGKHAEFIDAVDLAMGKTQVRWLAQIEQAGKIDWRAIAWKLERRFPEQFGKPAIRAEVTGKNDGPVLVEHAGAVSVELSDVLTKLSPDMLAALVSAIDEAEADDANGGPA